MDDGFFTLRSKKGPPRPMASIQRTRAITSAGEPRRSLHRLATSARSQERGPLHLGLCLAAPSSTDPDPRLDREDFYGVSLSSGSNAPQELGERAINLSPLILVSPLAPGGAIA